MEDALRRSGHRGVIEKEKRVDSVADKEDIDVKEPLLTNMEGSSLRPDNSRASSSSHKKEQDDQLESARAEMGEVREENERLKMFLEQITKEYQTLQMQFYDIVQQDPKKSKQTSNDHDQEVEENELVSLSLGRFSTDSKKEEKGKTSSQGKEEEQVREGLSLGLECKLEVSKPDANEALPNPSPANSFEEPKDEAGETWPPGKVLKTMRSVDEEISQQNPVKKARVSVRARCDTPTMNDGCQWRKYGQKIAKGNPCPRAYYRCTVAPSCPVRKQVQRCAEDMSILITTYEGTHNHPLPVSATAMASTTSAAASMLLSGSSSSSRPGSSAPSTTFTAANGLNGLNFYLTDSSKSKQFYLPNPSLSSTPSCPTITLDLTTAPSSSSSQFSRFTSNYPSTSRYPSTSLSFSSSESNAMSWSGNVLSYGSTLPYIKNQIGILNLGRQPTENIYQSYMLKNNVPTPPQQSIPADTIAAATKAITADPSFQSALVAALTSIIGTGNSGGTSQVDGDNFGVQKLKWGEQFPVASSFSETVKGNGCASSYLNKSSTTTNSQPGSLIFLPPSLPLSSSKSASASPVDNREQTN